MRSFLACVVALLTLAASGDSRGADDFPRPTDTEPSSSHPLAPDQAASRFRLPEGFRMGVFAAEPDVRNPIAMAWDPRGRLWIAENFTYAENVRKFDMSLRDRVLIFEDRDGDGKFDRRTVFTDEVQMLTSVELGAGGVWLMSPPRLLFVPDRNGDDIPDGPAEVVLDGFTPANDNHHTFANGLRWGPDGWLYGRCGASSPGMLGRPGMVEKDRVPLRGGIWRYHPTRRHVEVLTHGTTNPWGLDWDSHGEAFFVNTVNGHLWHLIQGAHLVRSHTIEPNPGVYSPIDQHADHLHWDVASGVKYTNGLARSIDDRQGGGHVHSGALIYEDEQWPDRYKGRLLTLNFHGRRINVERLERAGSGFLGRHEPDMAHAGDPWFRGLDLTCGPDGSVYLLDWSDTGECHEHEGVHRNSGRIFRLSYGISTGHPSPDLSRFDESALVSLHSSTSEWKVRQARRVLLDRQARGEPLREAREGLTRLMDGSGTQTVTMLRALWTLVSLGAVEQSTLQRLLEHRDESVRAWALRLVTDDLPLDTIDGRRIGEPVVPRTEFLTRFVAMARQDPSGLVRLVLASTLQRLPVDQRAELAEALSNRSEDAADPNLPSLIWTGILPLAERDPSALIRVARTCKIPRVIQYLARRLAEDIESRPDPLEDLLRRASAGGPGLTEPILLGMVDALAGWRKANPPGSWPEFKASFTSTTNDRILQNLRDLDVLFGDGRALNEVRRLAFDEGTDIEVRKRALRTLIDSRPEDLRTICEKLIRIRFLNAVAVRGLSYFDDPAAGRLLARNYRSFHPSERPLALAALVSRPGFAMALLDEMATGKIPRSELTAFQARQVLSLGAPDVTRRLAEVWGELRETDSERRARAASLRSALTPRVLSQADKGRGREVFARVCGTCHRLYGHGATVGPDLTGSGREDLGYLLENVLDPSAIVSADYRMVIVAMTDGRVLNGLVKQQTARTLTLQTPTEVLVLDRSEIEGVKESNRSLMPDGLLETLSQAEIRDLMAYLMSKTQVP